MVVPVLHENTNSVNAYFPQDTWFDFVTGELIKTYKQPAGIVTRNAPLNATAPVFLRGGHLVAAQDTTNVLRSDDLSNDYKLAIGFKETNTAGTHTAAGEVIGLKALDDHNMLVKCRYDNCLYRVEAKIVVTDIDFEVEIRFNAQGSVTNYEEITISYLYMSGDWAEKREFMMQVHEYMELEHNLEGELIVEKIAENALVYKFDTPFKVHPGALIKINLAKDKERFIDI